MLTIKNGSFEIIDNEKIKKIKGRLTDDTYVEIRYKNGWFDVLVSAKEGASMRSIYRMEVEKEMTIADMIKELDIIFE